MIYLPILPHELNEVYCLILLHLFVRDPHLTLDHTIIQLIYQEYQDILIDLDIKEKIFMMA